MITRHSMQQTRRTLLQKVGVEREQRSPDQLRKHYEIEKVLANTLRKSSREERRELYASLYDEFNLRIPFYAESASQQSSQNSSVMTSPQWRFLRRFLRNDAVFLEIGAGDCAMSLAVAPYVKKVIAVEVSKEISKSARGASKF